MTKASITAIAVLLAGSVSAQAAMNCDDNYKSFWDKVTTIGDDAKKRLGTSKVAAINRSAVRAYDACQAGDEQSAKSFFDKFVNIVGDDARGSEFWDNLTKGDDAKRGK